MPSNTNRSFRDALGSIRPQFNEEHWELLQREMELRKKQAAALPWKIAGAVCVAGIVAIGTWLSLNTGGVESVLADGATTHEVKPEMSRTMVEESNPPVMAPRFRTEPVIAHANQPLHGAEFEEAIIETIFPTVAKTALSTSLPHIELAPLPAYLISTATSDLASSNPVWEIADHGRRVDWRLQVNAKPGLTRPNPADAAGTGSIGASAEFADGWRGSVGLGMMHLTLPSLSPVTTAGPRTMIPRFLQSRLTFGKVTAQVERHLPLHGRWTPFIAAGTSVLLPVKECYDYEPLPMYTYQGSAQPEATIAYSALRASSNTKSFQNTTGVYSSEALSYTPQVHAGIVHGAVGLSYDLTEVISITAAMEVEHAPRPIGLEHQKFTTVGFRGGAEFNLFGRN